MRTSGMIEYITPRQMRDGIIHHAEVGHEDNGRRIFPRLRGCQHRKQKNHRRQQNAPRSATRLKGRDFIRAVSPNQP